MRSGALKVSSLMMSFGNGAQSTTGALFDIQKNNLFTGPKRPIKAIQALSAEESRVIQEKIASYQVVENRKIQFTIGTTIAICTLLYLWIF